MTAPTTHRFEAEVSQVLRLVINSLYSNKEIFIRELISNASDAIDKLRFESITKPELLGDDPEFRIRVIPNAEAHTLTIEDNGVGMSREELITNLGTIAHSGSRQFIEGLQKAAQAASQGDVSLIGQFGVGFYSSYLVADRVEVISRSAHSDEAWRWESTAEDTFTVEPAAREGRGTTIVLYLKDDQQDFLDTWRLRQVISRYADYVSHRIELPVERYESPEDSDTDEDQALEPTVEFEQVNEASALWQRSPSEVTKEQYNEFYKHLSRDWAEPLAHTHFSMEGTQLFKGLLFVPSTPPMDLFDPDSQHGIRLYVKRVLIMEDCKELLPRWLRFVRGVIDSDDLPLNVSRELLQDSRAVRVIQKQIVKKVIQLLEELATERADDYNLKFWPAFGRVLKEGLHFSPEHADKLAALTRFESSSGEGVTSLAEYVSRMPEDQPAIYYALGQSRRMLEGSPNLEVLKKRGYEVLYMTDGVDQWAVMGLNEFEGKKLVSAMTEELELPEDEQQKEEMEKKTEALKTLTERFNDVLQSRIREVRVSERLDDSPVCLVVPEGGVHAHIERMLRANDQEVPQQQRILEINPDHNLIKNLNTLQTKEPGSTRVAEWIELLYDQALITEGSPIEDPNAFARRMTRLMETVALSDSLVS